MYNENKLVKDPIKSTFDDLKLFEQNNYCFKYLKDNYPNIEEVELLYHAEIASSSFRQADAYYKSASDASINTSPLLYSYALNNLLKGVCYLKSFDKDILDGFNSHGFKLDREYLEEDALNSKVTFMKYHGAVHSLLKLYGNDLSAPQDIPLYKLLRHIPDLDSFYYETVGSISLIGTNNKRDNDEFIFNGLNINDETKSILTGFSMMINSIPRQKICSGFLTVKTQGLLRDKIFDSNNIFYKNYLNIPEEYIEGLKSINISFYCYLLIMAYGMMVRYDANIWEKYVDKKNSKYSTLIELSINNSVLNFYFQMHNQLFGFYYEDDNYNELDIKHIIDDSTADIMNNITKKIKHDNLSLNLHNSLPWRENIR